MQDSIVSFRTKNIVNLREGSSVNSKVITALDENEELIVVDSLGNWASVIIPDKNLKGFISKKYIQRNVQYTSVVESQNKLKSEETIYLFVGVIFLITIISIYFLNKNKNLKLKLKKYQPILDIEKEISDLENQKTNLNEEYLKGKNIYDELQNQIQIFNTEYDLIENGIYNPIFDFGASDEFKAKIKDNITEQKELIRDKEACVCYTEWTVSDSRREGKKMTNRQIRLTLRAFNGECDSLISKVNWNNVNKLKIRIEKTYEMINRLNETINTSITEEFLNLKIEELKLNYEYKLKKHQEKEEERERRNLIKEEEKARRDYEKAEKEAIQKEKIYNKALEEARKELGLASKEEVGVLEDKIKKLEDELAVTLEKFERAKSMAQQTKRGHIYVVSNVGSFGENIYKIGMTRRLDPMDRVKELGDASVPFRFDMHAMIYTEDAPKLESLLHSKFNHLRVNKINNRKEYFKVTIDEIQSCIEENFSEEFQLIKDFEAQEFKETLLLEEKESIKIQKKKEDKFPDKLF